MAVTLQGVPKTCTWLGTIRELKDNRLLSVVLAIANRHGQRWDSETVASGLHDSGEITDAKSEGHQNGESEDESIASWISFRNGNHLVSHGQPWTADLGDERALVPDREPVNIVGMESHPGHLEKWAEAREHAEKGKPAPPQSR
jgi:hypothetical protein